MPPFYAAHAQDYQQYRPPVPGWNADDDVPGQGAINVADENAPGLDSALPVHHNNGGAAGGTAGTGTATGGGSTSSNALPPSAGPVFAAEPDAATGDVQINSIKRVVAQTSAAGLPGVRRYSLPELDVDPDVGYPMPDIIVPKDAATGAPAVDLRQLNVNVPSLRARTSYAPGERRYLAGHASALLQIDRGFVYAFGDDIVVADASRVFVMGGCGENMAGWALAASDDGQAREWDSPDLDKDGFHRFSALAVLVQRLGRSFFHWMTETLPRLAQYLETLGANDLSQLRRLKYLAYDEPFIQDALQLMGVNLGRQVINFDPSSVYAAETLYAMSSAPCGQPPRPVMRHLQRYLYRHLYPPPAPGAPAGVLERARRRERYAARRGLALLVGGEHVAHGRKGRSGGGGGGSGGGGDGGSGHGSNEGGDLSGLENVQEVVDVVRRVFLGDPRNAGRQIELILVDGATAAGGGANVRRRGSMLAQYSLWRRAELVVAMPGGSLANLMWSQNGTKVVELMPILPEAQGRRATLTYADMAGSLDLPYALVPITTPSFHNGPALKVPVDFLESALKELMEVPL